MITIKNVIKNSPADKAGIKSGELLISLNGEKIADVLDYMFYAAEKNIIITLKDRDAVIKKDEYEDLGLEFDSFLMSESQRCRNKCIFCFIDQLPPKEEVNLSLRETLYFKDDDSRLSFLQGNYISLTNLTERDVTRIIKMKLGLNVSVHTTNPELRVQMLGNPHAGEALRKLYKITQNFASGGPAVNAQIVICPGINDGAELEKTLTDLTALEAVKSIACVPVGLTKFREKLAPLMTFDKQSAIAALEIISRFKNKSVFASDELYILAEKNLPEYEFYGDFPQYENGVGMLTLLEHEFMNAVGDALRGVPQNISEYPLGQNISGRHAGRPLQKKSLATGVLAQPYLEKLVEISDANVQVHAIRNDFFGEKITVAGLVTGQDLIKQLLPYKNNLGKELLIPKTMLRANDDVFLDDVTVNDVQNALNIKVRAVDVDGFELYEAFMD
ncbi:MAG: DUF512 domain-containing protein [Oscillospiraceae bacterium]|nr:DUF512 domain-containing protein [Oscillospiraceae bacterium]